MGIELRGIRKMSDVDPAPYLFRQQRRINVTHFSDPPQLNPAGMNVPGKKKKENWPRLAGSVGDRGGGRSRFATDRLPFVVTASFAMIANKCWLRSKKRGT